MKNGKTLTLVKMGCDFFNGDRINQLSDCENYRIETRKDLVKGKDGNEYFLSFGGYDKRRTRYTNKRTGAQLKHPVDEVVLENALHIDTEFDNENGYLKFKVSQDDNVLYENEWKLEEGQDISPIFQEIESVYERYGI